MNESRNNILKFLIAFFLIIFLFFQELSQFVFNFIPINYFDEMLMLMFFGIVTTNLLRKKTINVDYAVILSALFFLILISQIHPNSTQLKIILQSIIHLKLFFFYYLFRFAFKGRENLIKDILKIVFISTLMGLFVSFFLQESFTTFFDIKPVYRYGFVRASGFQMEVNHVAVTLSLYYLYFVIFKKNENDLRNFLFITSLFLVTTFLTGSRTVLVVIPIAFFFIYKNKSSFHLKYFLFILTAVSVIAAYSFLKTTEFYKITAQNMTDTFEAEDSSYIRGIMIYHGTNLAIENFPFGTGAASFGTVLSEGSPVYSKLGLDKMDFFIDMTGIYDSNIASVLGEFGFAGLVLFAFLFYYIYKKDLYREDNSESNNTKEYYQSLILLIIIYSISMSVMMNSYNSSIFALFLNLLSSSKTSKSV